MEYLDKADSRFVGTLWVYYLFTSLLGVSVQTDGCSSYVTLGRDATILREEIGIEVIARLSLWR